MACRLRNGPSFVEMFTYADNFSKLGCVWLHFFQVKSNIKGMTVGLNEDTLGGTMKASLAQYLALEISKGNGRDSRSVNR